MIETTTIWTCDRCKNRRNVRQEQQPEDWIGMLIPSPPKAGVDAGPRYQLCGDCRAKLYLFLSGSELKEPNPC